MGTSSWTDPEFVRDWYPEDLPARERLAWYARYFGLVEVNATFYALPKPDTVQRWVEQTPPDFVFDVKLPRLLSWHSTEYRTVPTALRHLARSNARGVVARAPKLLAAVIRELQQALEPLVAAKKLGAVLLQLSPAFSPRTCSLDDLDSILKRLPWITAVEFRNRGWATGRQLTETLDYLSSRGAAFVSVDGPRSNHFTILPPVWTATTPLIAYVRCHGRNVEGYVRGRTVPVRFDYDYPLRELREIGSHVKDLAEQVQEVHVLFNNNRSNYAPKAAARLKKLLRADAARTPMRSSLKETPTRSSLKETPTRSSLKETPTRSSLKRTPTRSSLKQTATRSSLRREIR